MLTAIVSPVPIGNRSIEGLLLQDGTYAIAVPQICSIFQFDTNQASRGIKAILGKGFQFDMKVKTSLNSKAVNAIALKDFKQLVFILAQKGDAAALRLWNKAHPEESQLNYVKPIALKLPKPGFIYLLEGSNCLKLGYSTNVEQRLKTLNRWIDELELVATVKGTIGTEKALHSTLHKTGDCLGEEWYPVYRKHEILGLMDVTLSDAAICLQQRSAIAQFTYEPMRYGHDKA